jgi:cytochrome c oxidase subunit IV
MTHEITSVKTYFAVFIALLVMTVTTAVVAFVDLGPFNIVVALTIAFIKALLVILYFMHVKQSSNVVKVTVAAGFFWLAIMITYSLSDYASRSWLPPDRAW